MMNITPIEDGGVPSKGTANVWYEAGGEIQTPKPHPVRSQALLQVWGSLGIGLV
jgi:hypothetical protein